MNFLHLTFKNISLRPITGETPIIPQSLNGYRTRGLSSINFKRIPEL